MVDEPNALTSDDVTIISVDGKLIIKDRGDHEAVEFVTEEGGRHTVEMGRIENSQYVEPVQTINPTGATEVLDLSGHNWFEVTLGADTTFEFEGVADGGQSFSLVLQQDGTGGRTPSWPSSVVWHGGTAPDPPADGGEVVELAFVSPDGGQTWRGRESWRATP